VEFFNAIDPEQRLPRLLLKPLAGFRFDQPHECIDRLTLTLRQAIQ
jgi:hypothetical protein